MPPTTHMSDEERLEAAARAHMVRATAALDTGDAVSAATEIVKALQQSFAIVRSGTDLMSPGYRQAWERVANELAKLPPSLIRHAVRILDEGSARE